MSDKTDINSLKSYCCMIIPYIATSHNTYLLSLFNGLRNINIVYHIPKRINNLFIQSSFVNAQ